MIKEIHGRAQRFDMGRKFSVICEVAENFKHMKSLFTLLLLSFTTITVAQNLPADPENYFDFWVGKWEVSWDEGEGKRGSGTNEIVKILDDKVIQENFKILEGQSAGFLGTSISVYQTQTSTWKQSWADSQGGFFYFIGQVDGNKRIFQTELRERPDGAIVIQRMVFKNITKDAFTWDWEASADGGTTWTLNWRIDYKRA